MLCNNVNELCAYLYAIFTTVELSRDMTIIDPEPSWLENVIKWWNGISWGWKLAIGIGLLIIAVALTIVTQGALFELLFMAGLTIFQMTLIQTVAGIAAGEKIGTALLKGFSEAVFWAGVFAFITAGIHAIKHNLSPKTRIKRQLRKAAKQYMAMQKALAPDAKALKELKFVTVAYDAATKNYQYGVNRGLIENGQILNPQLNDINVRINCAETQAVSSSLDAGSELGNLYLYTIKPNGMNGYACLQCSAAFYGRVAEILSGLHENFLLPI